MSTRKLLTRSWFFALTVLLTVSAIAITTPVKAKEKEILIVAGFVPESVDPVYLDTHNPLRMYGAIQYLFYISPEGKIVPELAKSYRNIDPNTWEVKLRPNATFWSGKKVDAKAVIASLERARKLAPQAKAILDGVSIKEVDPLTLHFITEKPNPFLFQYIATSQFLAIHNAQSFGDKVRPYDLEALDATGFFKPVKFKSTESAELQRFDGYWGDRPILDRITFRRNADPQAMIIEALSGKPHIIVGLPTEGAAPLAQSKDMDLVKVRGSVFSLYLNTHSPNLKDARVRQALGWAIDRQEVVALGYNGLGVPAPSWFASHPAYPEAKETGFIKYDPARAGQLLDEAGWKLGQDGIRVKNDKPLKIKLVAYGIHKAGAEVIQNQLRKIGVDIDLQYSKDWGFLVAMRKGGGPWDITLEAWSNFGIDRLWRHFASEEKTTSDHSGNQ